MATRLRGIGQNGVPALDTNHNSFDKPEFGIGRGANGITDDMYDWQAEPLDVNDPRAVYPLNFRDNPNTSQWRMGTPVFTIREPGTLAQTALDISQVQELAWDAAQNEMIRSRDAARAVVTTDNEFGVAEDRSWKRTIHADVDNIFSSMSKVRELLDFSGVLFRAPAPYTRTGRRKDQFSEYRGGPRVAPLQLFGGIQIPNMWDHYPHSLTPGQRLWLIIKPIALSSMVECKSSSGDTKRMTNYTPEPTDQVIAFIWYTNKNGKPPPRASNMEELYKRHALQPPLYSRSYKEYQTDDKGKKQVSRFVIEDALIINIGTVRHHEPPINSSDEQRNSIRSFSLDELNRKKPVHIYVSRPGHNSIPFV